VNVSGLIWDADLIVPAANRIRVDHITEATGAHGIVTDVLLRPALGVTLAGGQILSVDHVAQVTGGHNIVTDNYLFANAAVIIDAASDLQVDHIRERSAGHNIILDNTETGRQQGTGNSATGAVLAGAYPVVGSDATYRNLIPIRRAGTYRLWISGHWAGATTCRVFYGAVGAFANVDVSVNAARTEHDGGDIVLAANEFIAVNGGASGTLCDQVNLYNADGMLP
jgi:hypothetical protein